MARGGLEPPTPRFSVVLRCSPCSGDLQAIPVILQVSRVSAFSRTLRPFRGGYGRRQGPSAFSLGPLRQFRAGA